MAVLTTELVSQMRAVSNRLSNEDGKLGELGEMIDDWAEQVEAVSARTEAEESKVVAAIDSALVDARGFHPKPPGNGA